MGFGIGLGAAASSAMSTYTTLSKLRQAQDEQDARNAERARDEADRKEYKSTMDRVGAPDYLGSGYGKPLIEATGLTAEQAETVQRHAATLPKEERAGLMDRVVQGSSRGVENQAAPSAPVYTRGQAYSDLSGRMNDMSKAVAFGQQGEKLNNTERVKSILNAGTVMAGGNVMEGLQAITDVHGTVPDGFTSTPIMKDGKPFLQVTNDKDPKQVQFFDVSTPMAQNVLLTRALAGVDPDTYMPVHQQALQHWGQATNTQNGQVETRRHNSVAEGISQQTADQTGDYQDIMGGVAQQNARTQESYRQDMADAAFDRNDAARYGADVRGPGGRGAAGSKPVDPNVEASKWANVNKGLMSYTDENGKSVPHAGSQTLAVRAYKMYGEGGATELMGRVQSAAAEASVDPKTGNLNQALYVQNLSKMTAAALAKINEKAQGKTSGEAAPAAASGPALKMPERPAGLNTKRGQAAGEPPRGTGMSAAPAGPAKVTLSRDGRSVSAPGMAAPAAPAVSPVSPQGLRARANAPLSAEDIQNLKLLNR